MQPLTRTTFGATAARNGIRRDAYSLDGGPPDERYCVEGADSGRWVVYYSERGTRTGERIFDSEATALEFLLGRLLADPTARHRASS